MESNETPKVSGARKWITSVALVASGLVAGGIVGITHIAGAATTPSSSATATAPTQRMDPATVAHGPNETLLTGTTAAKAKAAALKAVPGASVIRVETDSHGAAYEAHMRKADGSIVTVELDKNFNVTGTHAGFCAHGPGDAHSTTGSNA